MSKLYLKMKKLKSIERKNLNILPEV